MAPITDPDPSPVDPPTEPREEYGIAPLPKHWSEVAATSPTATPPDEYAVGEEVPEAPFHPEAKTWREIVASNRLPQTHDRDDAGELYDVGPQATAVERRRPGRWAMLANEVAARLRTAEDQRIGRLADPRRFTLGRLLFVFTLASIVLAVGARMPRGVFAGVAGLATLATALLSRWLIGGSAIGQLAWWTLMAIYLLASLFSLLNL